MSAPALASPVTVLATPLVLPRLTTWLGRAGYRVRDGQTLVASSAQPNPPVGETVDDTCGGHLLAETRACGGVARRGHLLSETRPSALWDGSGGTLVTYLPETTRAVVTTDLLTRLPAPVLWLQLAPMPLEDAHFLARRARAAGATMFHAPYLQDPAGWALPADPSVQDRPACLVYGPVAVTSRGRADALVRAVSWYARWTGPLETEIDSPCRQELLGLGDHVLQHRGHLLL